MKKLGLEDKKLLITLSIDNRNYLTTCADMILTKMLAFTSAGLSFAAVYISIFGNLSAWFLLPLAIVLGAYWFWSIMQYKRMIGYSKKLNAQYQEYFFELYPELKRGKFYH